MDNFLINIEYNEAYNGWTACYADGKILELGAGTFEDAVLEADLIESYEYQS